MINLNVWKSFKLNFIIEYTILNVGFHFCVSFQESWGYTSKWTNDYSIVLTGAAFYHKYFNYLYTEWLSPLMLKTVEQSNNCEDILMNFLISHVTRRSPIKVTQRKHYKEQTSGSFSRLALLSHPEHLLNGSEL